MPFGGEIKLTGESEYRKAIENITSDLGKMSDALQKQANEFGNSDSKMKNTAQKQKELTEALKQEKEQLAKAKDAYAQYSVAVQTQQQRHQALSKEYKSAVTELDRIEKECGKASDEYKKQQEIVDKLGQELADSNREMNESKQAMNQLKSEINAGNKAINTTQKELNSLGKEEDKDNKKTKDLSKSFDAFNKKMAQVGKVVAGAVTALGAVATVAGKAIWDMSNSVAQAGDEIDKSSQKLGISAENYQTLSYAMERSGASIDDVSKGVKTITSELANFENGVEGAGEKFDALGVSLQNADGSMKTTEQVLLDSIDALSSMENETQRNALAQEIFGKSASELAPLLNSGSEGIHQLMQEAKDYGMVMSDDAVNASAMFEDSLTRLQGTFSGLKNNIIGEFLPSITQITDGFTNLLAGQDGASEQIQAGVQSLLDNLTGMIPQVVEMVSTIATAVLESAPTIIEGLSEGILEAIPQLLPVVMQIVTELTTTLVNLLPQLIEAGIQILVSLIKGITTAIPQLIKMLPTIIKTIVDVLLKNLPEIIDAGVDLLMALIDGLSEAIPELITYVPEIIATIVSTLIENLPKILSAGVDILGALIKGIVDTIPSLIQAIPDIVNAIIDTIGNYTGDFIQSGIDVVMDFIDGIGKKISDVTKKAGEVGQAVLDKIKEFPDKMLSVGGDLVEGIWNGISDKMGWIKERISGWVGDVTKFFKGLFGIKSPSKLFRDEIGTNLALGIGEGFSDEMSNVSKEMADAIPKSFDIDTNISRSGAYGSNYYMMVDAFKEALGQMKIELDDDEVGRFIDKTVTRLVYN